MRITELKVKVNNNFLPFLVSILPPSVFLLYLYQRNAAYFSILHTLIAIAIFTLSAVVLHLIILKLIKSSVSTTLINNLLWTLFFTIKAPYWEFNLYARKNLVIYLSIILVITLIIITLIIRYKNKLHEKIINSLSVFWLVLFIFNAVPAFVNTISNYSTYITDEKNYKTEFNVDNSLPSPNIYWLHMDGMLGFKAMEYLFNDPQLKFTTQLTERGFFINNEAQFEGLHRTVFAVPVMMSPYHYDVYLSPLLRSLAMTDYQEKIKYSHGKELSKYLKLFRTRNELIFAFKKKGYQTYAIYSNFPVDNLYFNEIKIKKIKETNDYLQTIEQINDEINLLFSITPLSKTAIIFNSLLKIYIEKKINKISTPLKSIQFENVERFLDSETYNKGDIKFVFSAIADVLKYSGQKLLIIYDTRVHSPYMYDEHMNIIKRDIYDSSDPFNYLPMHNFARNIVISYIDFILNADKDAIIVLQSDHGLHNEETGRLMISKYGKTIDDVRLMQNQTISAVRIPEKWGSLNEPIEPPNITRLLVNRFVGDNYKLLASEDIIK